jgi:hypothetical protein
MGSRVVVTFLVLVAILVAVVLWYGVRSMEDAMGFDRGFHRRYRSVSIGMAEQDAFSRMGRPPDATNRTLVLAQRGRKREDRARRTDAILFFTWGNGADYAYCLGVNSNGTVVVKEEGGT